MLTNHNISKKNKIKYMYKTHRLKPIRMHLNFKLYYTKNYFILYKKLFYINYFNKLLIWNLFNFIHVLNINEFLLFYKYYKSNNINYIYTHIYTNNIINYKNLIYKYYYYIHINNIYNLIV